MTLSLAHIPCTLFYSLTINYQHDKTMKCDQHTNTCTEERTVVKVKSYVDFLFKTSKNRNLQSTMWLLGEEYPFKTLTFFHSFNPFLPYIDSFNIVMLKRINQLTIENGMVDTFTFLQKYLYPFESFCESTLN